MAANSSTVFLPQIETPEAVANAADIAAVDAVDVLFVGPLDLSTNMGHPGDFTSPAFAQALSDVAQAARAAGKAAGIFAPGPRLAQLCAELGYTVFSYGADVGVFVRGLAAGVQEFRSLEGAAGAPDDLEQQPDPSWY